MKRILSLLTLALVTASAWAQYWKPKTSFDYRDYNAYYVQVKVNGQDITGKEALEVAAFIDGDCRATQVSAVTSSTGKQAAYQLLVAGDLATETGKNIDFKVRYKELNYSCSVADADTSKVHFNNLTNTPSSSIITLYLDVLTDLQVKDIEVEAQEGEFPYEVDMSDKVTFVYGDSSYVRKNLSVCEDTYTTTWRVMAPNGAPVSGFSYADGKITISEAVEGIFTTQCIATTPSDSIGIRGTGYLNVKIADTPVDSITVGQTAFTVYPGDDVSNLIKNNVTIYPATATYKDYTLSVVSGNPSSFDGKAFKHGGYYTLVLKSTDPTYTETDSILVAVREHPSYFTVKEEYTKIGMSKNVEEAIKENLILTFSTSDLPDELKDDSLDIDILSGSDIIGNNGCPIDFGEIEVEVSIANGLVDTTDYSVYPSGKKYMKLTVESKLKVSFMINNTKFFKNSTAPQASPAIVLVNNPDNEPFDESLLTLDFDMERYTGFPYAVVTGIEPAYNDSSVQIGYQFVIEPKFVGNDIKYHVNYNANPVPQSYSPSGTGFVMPSLNIYGTENLEEGWNWVSINSVLDPMFPLEITSAFGDNINDIEQIRAQATMVFNDPEWGLFGDLRILIPNDGFYKINALNATTLTLGSYNCFETGQAASKFMKGYNWTNNPCEFDVLPTQFEMFFGFIPNDNDMIITQDGMAICSGGFWISDDPDFRLKAGKGFIYYNTGEVQFGGSLGISITPEDPSSPVKKGVKAERSESFFNYNPRAFADKMSMIARIEGLTDAENFEVGAFVGDECRGKGQVATKDIFFINATGEKGEKMTFKLYNKQTGELTDIEEVVSYDLVKGALNAPVKLHAPEATGIRSLNAAQQTDANIYDISGRRVERAAKGLYIMNGKTVMVK